MGASLASQRPGAGAPAASSEAGVLPRRLARPRGRAIPSPPTRFTESPGSRPVAAHATNVTGLNEVQNLVIGHKKSSANRCSSDKGFVARRLQRARRQIVKLVFK